jgi:hypothetical protein
VPMQIECRGPRNMRVLDADGREVHSAGRRFTLVHTPGLIFLTLSIVTAGHKALSYLASRRGLEPLTPGLGSVGSGC